MESTTQLVNETFVFVMLFIACTVTYAVLSHRRDEDGPTNGRRLLDALAARYLIPSSDADDGIETADSTASEPVLADSIPSSERDIIIALARLRGGDGQYRYSANEITKFIKLSRNEVLDIIRPERSGKAEIPDTYQAEPVTPRTLAFARTLPDGKVVRVDQWGVEWVQQENQLIPVDMYIAHFLTPQAA